MPEALNVERHVHAGGLRLAVAGEVDVAGGGLVREAMEEAGRDRVGELALDLREVTFLDSSGLAAILHGARTLTALESRLTTRCPHGSEARLVIEMAGVGRLLGLQD
jgi:anti-sigma B factor antagonist